MLRLTRNHRTRVSNRMAVFAAFLLIAMLFILDLLVPDLLPFVDEILLGLGLRR